MKRFQLFFAVGPIAALLVGCDRVVKEVAFEPNYVLAYRLQVEEGVPMEQALAETTHVLDVNYGTPDDPKLPEAITSDDDLKTMVPIKQLEAASGSMEHDGRGLYRQYCATCHGITGNGRGPVAAFSTPYPRDYRMGLFKFKSTPRGRKPTRDDLLYSIEHGIAGTPMKPLQELAGQDVKITDDDVQALASYVVYLAMRGEVERTLLEEAALLAYDEGEFLHNAQVHSQYKSMYDEDVDPETIVNELQRERYELYVDNWELIQDAVIAAAESWLDAEDQSIEVPEPVNVPVPETVAEVVAAAQAEGDSPIKQSIARGKELFLSDKASCTKCHGKQGHGDGTNSDFDDWAKDWAPQWTRAAAANPKLASDFSELTPYIARGVLQPKPIVPRDFREGTFHGGSQPERIYLRIANGIDGTPMPSIASGIEPDQIWDLVNFVRSLKTPDKPL